MTVLVDPPLWPAHGRHWSHLVSDRSLHELRTFARAAGIPDRGFDLDHYDVPADRYDDLVAAGAVPVVGRELSSALAASGLRVPGWERARARPAALRARWARLWVDQGATPAGATAAVGEELVERWGEPHRVYHSRLHLADTLDALDGLLAAGTAETTDGAGRLAALALWFHDAVHDGATPADEEESAALARTLLPPCRDEREASRTPGPPGDEQAEEVARLVRVTVDHDPAPTDHVGALVSDADLAVLGATPARYARYTAQVRAEYGHVDDGAFRAGRAAVLEGLLALHTGRGLFRTEAGRRRWAARAAENLRAELAALTA
ncbi:DUF4031 domain-containing protein [Isoptericola sp. b515]|uniref:DUF4031 domain-containing protein n=1 Tax=Isoptericola sp. b515 TaxID=3064652 RepID=UPI0027126D39|nr:DUF4031 domain-containing protein [Isoptericola sp. b515]MDO8146980.1 DUF4031 domain-containing protein [Isoptericola sp. b515]